MIYSIPYTCIGSENPINIPASSGKDVIAVLVDGLNKEMIVDTPESDDQVQIDASTGYFTFSSSPYRGLNVLVIYRMRSEDTGGLSGETNLNDFLTGDFAQGDFF